MNNADIVIRSVQYAKERASEQDLDEDALSDETVEKYLHRLIEESNHQREERTRMSQTIFRFFHSGDAPKGMVRRFCYRAAYRDTDTATGQTIRSVPQKFLDESELERLYKYVRARESDKSFGSVVYELIERHGMTAPQVYRNAMLSRQDFSRITNERNGSVKKSMVWNVIVGLHCTVEEADRVLYSAGYIRRNNYSDLILVYFLEHKNYDIVAINDALLLLKQKPLTCYIPVKDKDPFS